MGKIKIEEHTKNMIDNGYTIIRAANSPGVVDKIKREIKIISDVKQADNIQESPDWGSHSSFGIQNESLFILKTMFSHPVVKPILTNLLNDPWYRAIESNRPNYKCRNGIRAQTAPKEGVHLHIDSFIPGSGKRPWLIQVFMILEDQDESNGSAIVVPKSHRSDEYAKPEHREEAIALCPNAGDIVMWDGRIWHGTLPNIDCKSRLVLASGFISWFLKPHFNLPNSIPDAFYQKLTDDEKVILGFASPIFRDEFDSRITPTTHNGRSGYDIFPTHAPSYYRQSAGFEYD